MGRRREGLGAARAESSAQDTMKLGLESTSSPGGPHAPDAGSPAPPGPSEQLLRDPVHVQYQPVPFTGKRKCHRGRSLESLGLGCRVHIRQAGGGFQRVPSPLGLWGQFLPAALRS